MPEEDKPFKDERTEAPTVKKLKKTRDDGNVFMSQEMAIVLVIFFSAWILRASASWIFQHLHTLLITSMDLVVWFRIDPGNFQDFMVGVMIYVARFLLPVSFMFMVGGGAATLLQTGWVVSFKKAVWKFEDLFKMNWKALNPLDPRKLMDLLLNLVKIGVLGWVLYDSYRSSVPQWLPFLEQEMIQTWMFLWRLIFWVVMKLCFFLFIIALIDYTYKHKKWWNDLKMTKWEVKEEKKNVEGDPRIKALLRSRRLALFRRIMMESVPKADVVITNPTHFAVAIQYDAEAMEAPKIVAKGAGKMAERIKEIARSHGIPLVENKALAQVLFKSVDVGQFVPVSLYKAVAEVLAYVYRLKNRSAA